MPNRIRVFTHHSSWPMVVTTTLIAVLSMLIGTPSAQRGPVHLNRMIEKLARGNVVFGASTSDLTLGNARALATSDLDWVYIDMEHSPMNFEALRTFLVGMIDKAAAVKKGSAQPNVTPWARFAPYGRENVEWTVKQGLDQGLMGVMFTRTETREHALHAVQQMRYPQRKGSPHMEPAGQRGSGAANALWFWGISAEEYDQRADLWPLNPQGDLLAVLLVESAAGVKNINEMLAVPGVGAVYIGPSDLARSLGVAGDAPEVEAAVQTILKACLAHKVPCGITANNPSVMTRRVKEGFKILSTGGVGGGVSPSADAALRAGRAAIK